MLTLNKHSKHFNEKNIYLKIVQQNSRGCVGPRGGQVKSQHRSSGISNMTDQTHHAVLSRWICVTSSNGDMAERGDKKRVLVPSIQDALTAPYCKLSTNNKIMHGPMKWIRVHTVCTNCDSGTPEFSSWIVVLCFWCMCFRREDILLGYPFWPHSTTKLGSLWWYSSRCFRYLFCVLVLSGQRWHW